MVKQHVSMRGEVVDFNRLRINNAEKVALGNASLNAKGDVIGSGGVVLKTQEQIETEFHAKIAEQQELTKTVNIKSEESLKVAGVSVIVDDNPVVQEQQKQLDVADANFEPEVSTPVQTPKARRKIVESD